MTYVVTEACIRCKYTDCVEVCPMQCFLDAGHMLVIDPSDCIECAMCVPECPVDAIVHVDEISARQRPFVAVNAALARAPASRPIHSRQPPPGDHAHWATIKQKRHLLRLEPPLDAEV
jgi:ferredoxin